MFRNLKLSTKILAVLMPLFFLTVAVIVFFNYAYQESTTLEQAKSAATNQALTIKESLVNMMTTRLKVDREFLDRVSKVSDVSDVRVWYRADSLKLIEDYRTPKRTAELRSGELPPEGKDWASMAEMFSKKEPVWILTCSLGRHADQSIDFLSQQTPKLLSSCEQLKAVIPFVAEQKCQECHEVRVGDVLGAAHMVIPLSKTTTALRANALQSVYIFVFFSAVSVVIGFFVFRKFVSRPLQKLVDAAGILGEGKLDHELVHNFDHDEFGRLATAFEDMQVKLQEVQRQLVHNERLSTVGQMASSIIHDFRSPMTGVGLAIDRLQKGPVLSSEERNELFALVRVSIDRMNRMMQELLDFSRGEVRLQHTTCSIEEFAGTVVRSVEMDMKNKDIRFSSETVFRGEAVFDRDRLLRALVNILSNAAEATPRGGEIRLTVSSADGLLIFRIQDTGAGIPRELRERVFEPFVTYGKERGTGLGLAISKRIVGEHFGEISFESEEGKGTTFLVKLPLKPPFRKAA